MLHWLQSASQCVPAKPQTDHGCLGGMASVLKLLRLSSALIALAFSCSHENGRSQVQGKLVADAVKLQGVQLAFLQNVCLWLPLCEPVPAVHQKEAQAPCALSCFQE